MARFLSALRVAGSDSVGCFFMERMRREAARLRMAAILRWGAAPSLEEATLANRVPLLHCVGSCWAGDSNSRGICATHKTVASWARALLPYAPARSRHTCVGLQGA